MILTECLKYAKGKCSVLAIDKIIWTRSLERPKLKLQEERQKPGVVSLYNTPEQEEPSVASL